MASSEFTEALRRNFKERLMVKTGWGRNEVMAEFEAAINDAENDHSADVDTDFDEKVMRVLERVNLIVRK